MRKGLACVLVMALLCTGCAPSVPVSAPAQTPVPTPLPQGVDKAFGGSVRLAYYQAGAGEWFGEGVVEQAEKLGMQVKAVEEPAEANSSDLLVAFDPEGMADYTGVNVPVILYTCSEALPSDGYGVVYDAAAEAQAALDAMFTYPSHEAPVRIVGLFSTSDGALPAYMQMQSDGKLQDKGAWTPQTPAAASAWLQETLGGITPGVLDTVFAGDAALAIQAYRVLRGAGRGDAVEVCAAGLSREQITAMGEDHFLMGTATGPNEYGAGMLIVRMAAFLLADEPVENVTLPPFTVYSDDVIALYRAGTTDANDIISQLDAGMAQRYTADFIRELTEYYAA